MLKLFSIFAAVFLAELGDKTQLATVLFATDKEHSPFTVFLAAAGALVLSTALAVALGSYGARYLQAIPLKLIAGLGFVAIGLWNVFDHFRG
jgi:putative Ca2+/H+ antiporter (TMEM165/GDT1 family)